MTFIRQVSGASVLLPSPYINYSHYRSRAQTPTQTRTASRSVHVIFSPSTIMLTVVPQDVGISTPKFPGTWRSAARAHQAQNTLPATRYRTDEW